MAAGPPYGGTGTSLAHAVVIVAGVSALVASLLSFVSIWLQTKNYRKPLLQRYVIRILLMSVLAAAGGVKAYHVRVPIYAVSSWTSIISIKASLWFAPIRDVYEAFTIYTFFQLLINFIGGERALIIMTHGRPPVQHAWPLNHCFSKVDISDPQTFLAVKRGILQYVWLKPVLAVISIAMKATDTYQEGYLGIASGYLWTGIVYNISVTISLYSLAMFWVCVHDDLIPFRPVPKFLCIKLIIFASYWQGFFLSILQWLGALPNGAAGYTPDNLAAAIQDSLICFEMPLFALAHWYGFSWHDYADNTISAARLPIKYALRDAFGVKDLIEDTKMTLRRENYAYRMFDSGDNIIAHIESNSRVRRVMDGMRYERGGKGKYWIPKPGGTNSRTPLLADTESSRRNHFSYASGSSVQDQLQGYSTLEGTTLDQEDEQLFTNARALEFGDWNYPVITANEVASGGYPREAQLSHSVRISEPIRKYRKRRKSRTVIGTGAGDANQEPLVKSGTAERGVFRFEMGSSSRSRNDQLVNLIAGDHEADAQTYHQIKDGSGASPITHNNIHPIVSACHTIDESRYVNLSGDKDTESSSVVEEQEDPERTRSTIWSYGSMEDNIWNR